MPQRLRVPRVLALGMICALAATGFGASGARAEIVRLGHDVVPIFEAVHLTVDPDRPDYVGSVQIDLDVKKETDRFRFHARSLTLDRVVLIGTDLQTTLTPDSVGNDLMEVRSTEPLAPGRYSLSVSFHSLFDTTAVGLYRGEAGGRHYVFTQFEAADARRAFPCWDEPGFKIPWQIRTRIPKDLVAVGNTAVRETRSDGDWKTVIFTNTKPLPSYLVELSVGPFDTVPITGMGVPGSVVTVKGQSRLAETAARETPAIMSALERWFERPYPYGKLDLIAAPEFWPGAMENAGAITFADRILLVDAKEANPARLRNLVRVTAHEISHQWFGDLVTMTWWDDLWLNESFADWMGDKITQEVHPELHQDMESLNGSLLIMDQDARPSAEAVRQPIDSISDMLGNVRLAYNKGKAVLGMFESWVGPEDFRKGINAYLTAHAWGNASAADLWAALADVSGKDVAGGMATFIEQPGFPLITVDLLPDGKARLTQERFRNHGTESKDLTWKVPVVLTYPAGDSLARRTVYLDSGTKVVNLGLGAAPAWVYPNGGAHGYYRWRTSSEVSAALAAAAPSALSPREQVEFLSDLHGLLGAGAVGADDYYRTLKAFSGTSSPFVVEAVINGLAEVKDSLVPDSLADAYAVYVGSALRPALERFGKRPRPGEDDAVTLIRPRLLVTLGESGRDPGVLAYADSMAQLTMQYPDSVPSSLHDAVLRLAAFHGNASLYDAYRQRFEAAKTPVERQRYLTALASFRDPALQEKLLDFALQSGLRTNELFAALRGMPEDEASRDLVFRWVMDHYGAIRKRLPPAFSGLMATFAGGCSPDRLASARSFFAEPGHGGPGVDRALQRVADGVSACEDLGRREGAAAAGYLTEFRR
jgi:alanyl aminopeptidase